MVAALFKLIHREHTKSKDLNEAGDVGSNEPDPEGFNGMWVQVNLIPLASNPGVMVDMVDLTVQLQHL